VFIQDFLKIDDCDFTIFSLAAFEKTVQPPVPFVCRKGDVLYARLFYIVKGKIIFNIRDTVLEFSAGNILYLPYDVTYTSRWDIAEEGEFITINFILKDKTDQIIMFSDTIQLFYNDSAQKYYPLFKEMANTWNNGGSGYKFLNHAQFYNILYNLYKDKVRRNLRTSYNRIYKSILYLDNHYLSDVSTAELAAMSGLKECMFRRIFKEIKKMSPMQYRNMLRINKAAETLQTGDFSVIEAMLLAGFNDMSYFYKLFKKQFGKAPSYFIPK